MVEVVDHILLVQNNRLVVGHQGNLLEVEHFLGIPLLVVVVHQDIPHQQVVHQDSLLLVEVHLDSLPKNIAKMSYEWYVELFENYP